MVDTTLCYIEKDGKYLMMHRNKKKNDLNEGKWVGVGGHVEEGETPDECLVREVYEETGLTLTSFRLRGVIEFVSDKWEDERMYLYSADQFTGQLNYDCNEGTLEWVAKEDIFDLPLWEGDEYFLEELIAGHDDINLRLVYHGDELIYCNWN